MNSRRQFILTLVPAAVAITAAPGVLAADAPHADENDAAAKGIGYKHDGSKVDAAKYPTYAKDKKCNNCALFQGKATDAWAPCPLLGGKQVAGNGWCSAWNKKA